MEKGGGGGGGKETPPVPLGLKVNNILTIFLLLYILLSSSECFVMFERLLRAKILSVTSEMHEWKSIFAEISLLWTFNVEVTVGRNPSLKEVSLQKAWTQKAWLSSLQKKIKDLRMKIWKDPFHPTWPI